jgi:hypothetical protein
MVGIGISSTTIIEEIPTYRCLRDLVVFNARLRGPQSREDLHQSCSTGALVIAAPNHVMRGLHDVAAEFA